MAHALCSRKSVTDELKDYEKKLQKPQTDSVQASSSLRKFGIEDVPVLQHAPDSDSEVSKSAKPEDSAEATFAQGSDVGSAAGDGDTGGWVCFGQGEADTEIDSDKTAYPAETEQHWYQRRVYSG
jgi:hypothetical protein